MSKLSISVLFCLLVFSPVFSQIEEKVEVDLIEIWAKVTDRDHRLVTDLGAEDFEVYIDGKKMQIRCFDKTFASAENLDSSDEGSKELKRKFVFFFDLLNSSDGDIHFLKQAVVDFMNRSFEDGDEGMVFVLLPTTKLGVVQKMTSNKESLMDVINRMRGNTMLQARVRNNERQLLEFLYTFGSTSGSSLLETGQGARAIENVRQARNLARSFALIEENLSRLTLSSFISISDYLSRSDFAGRLIMIYVSGGFSVQPGQNYYEIINKALENHAVAETGDFIFRDNPDMDFSRETRNVLGLLNRLNVTIYSIDAAGLRENDIDVQKGTREVRLGSNNIEYARTLQDSLVLVAQETGGMAFTGGQNFQKGLSEIASDMSQQYWLCSNLPHTYKKGYHKVEVKVLRPGLHVRHRKGYVS